MNMERFNHFWIHVIDMHNHHSVGDLRWEHIFGGFLFSAYIFRHAVNPTSPFRMELILKAILKEKAESAASAASSTGHYEKSTGFGSGFSPVNVDAADSLVAELQSMKLSSGPVPEVSCKCTRKCKTKLCQCFKNSVSCNSKCHLNNNSCINK